MNYAEKIFKKLLNKYFQEIKIFGAAFEYDLPPEFIITKHAEERILERRVCKKEKILKVATKAWVSKDQTLLLHRKRTKEDVKWNKKYRSFNGMIYVFTIKHHNKLMATQKKLITVINPKEPSGNNRT